MLHYLVKKFHSLNEQEKKNVHILLCEHAVQQWNQYVKENQYIKYTDSVVGLNHVVDNSLLEDALKSVKCNVDSSDVESRFEEPIAAIDDDDLILPEHIRSSFLALYNLFEKYALSHSVDDSVILNFAVSSEENEDLWDDLFLNSIKAIIKD